MGNIEELVVGCDPAVEALPWREVLHHSLRGRRHGQGLVRPRNELLPFSRARGEPVAFQQQDARSGTVAQQYVPTAQEFH
jgi:hypothetical protein